ncbi:MAG: RNA polymerase sigma factor [Jatrophihabitans sp.]
MALLTDAVHRAQAGDEAAFTHVYRLVQPVLIRYLRVLVGTDADDVASETWAHVCRDLHRFRGDGDGFRGWVATIGRHRAVDHLRARGRRPADPVPVQQLADIPASAQTDTAALEAVSTASAVALIASLPPDQAEAVMLRTVMGLDAATAGKVLGKRPGAVRVAAHRGLRTLASRLEAPAE